LRTHSAPPRTLLGRDSGFSVRDASGGLIPEAVKHAKREALKLSNRLIAGARLSEDTPKPVTLGELVALFRRWRVETEGELTVASVRSCRP